MRPPEVTVSAASQGASAARGRKQSVCACRAGGRACVPAQLVPARAPVAPRRGGTGAPTRGPPRPQAGKRLRREDWKGSSAERPERGPLRILGYRPGGFRIASFCRPSRGDGELGGWRDIETLKARFHFGSLCPADFATKATSISSLRGQKFPAESCGSDVTFQSFSIVTRVGGEGGEIW